MYYFNASQHCQLIAFGFAFFPFYFVSFTFTFLLFIFEPALDQPAPPPAMAERSKSNGEESKEQRHRLLQLTNCRLVRGHRLIRDDLWVRDGRIVNPEPIFFDEQATAHRRIDCGGAIIAPGYIDLQINGESIPVPIRIPVPIKFHFPLALRSINRQGRCCCFGSCLPLHERASQPAGTHMEHS